MRETDIRNKLRSNLRSQQRSSDYRIIDEMGLCNGSVRVDMAVINGSLQGYEIKSAQDTLKRLPEQAKVYSQVFDSVSIVTTRNHLEEIEALVPSWWGIIEAKSRGSEVALPVLRKQSPNPHLDPYAMAQLLWRDEALGVLENLGLAKGLRSKPRQVLWKKLAESLSPLHLGEVVRARLKARSGWLSDQSLTRCDG